MGRSRPPRGTQHSADPRVRAVGHHDIAGFDGPAAGGALLLDGHPGQGRERARQRGSLIDDGTRHLRALQQGRPGLLGVPATSPSRSWRVMV